jgi:hypothetical protein
MATPASADTINLISDGAGLQVLDDESLADIRGKGAEGADVTAPDQVAVILWDELGTGRPSGQKGGGQVASANATSVQSFSHTATRH